MRIKYLLHLNSILFLIILLFMCTQVSAQIKLPEDNFIQGWIKSEAPRIFKKSALFNHINGGAEIFHEFGFDELIVQNYKNESDEIAIEIYQMESPTSALGIYLLRCGVETPLAGILARNSSNRFQSTIVSGNYFTQINNFSGNESNIPVMVQSSQFLLSKLKTKNQVKVLSYLPQKDLVSGSEMIIRGKYGLEPIYTFGQGDILNLKGKIFAVIGDYKNNIEQIFTQLIIPYPDEKYANEVFNNLSKNLDPYLELIKLNQKQLIFKDYQNKYGIIEIKKNIIEIKIHLDKQPDGAIN